MNVDAQKQYITDVITAASTGLVDGDYSTSVDFHANNGTEALYSGYFKPQTYDGTRVIDMRTSIYSLSSKHYYPYISVSRSCGNVRKIKVNWFKTRNVDYKLVAYGRNSKPCDVEVSSSAVTIRKDAVLGTIYSTSSSKSDSIEVNGDYEYITLAADKGTSAPSVISIEIEWDYTYTRPTTPDKFGTICLPYNVPYTNYEGAEFYSIAGVNKDASDNVTAVVLQEETNLVAGTPYIFKATGSTLSATYTNGKSDVQSATGLVGWMPADDTSTTDVPTGSYILSNNEIHQITGNATATIGPNRAYLNLAGVPTYVPNPGEAKGRILRLGLDGSITDLNPAGIEEITNDDNTSISAIYSLDGNKFATMRKGINIVKMKNGTIKKVHIK